MRFYFNFQGGFRVSGNQGKFCETLNDAPRIESWPQMLLNPSPDYRGLIASPPTGPIAGNMTSVEQAGGHRLHNNNTRHRQGRLGMGWSRCDTLDAAQKSSRTDSQLPNWLRSPAVA